MEGGIKGIGKGWERDKVKGERNGEWLKEMDRGRNKRKGWKEKE